MWQAFMFLALSRTLPTSSSTSNNNNAPRRDGIDTPKKRVHCTIIRQKTKHAVRISLLPPPLPRRHPPPSIVSFAPSPKSGRCSLSSSLANSAPRQSARYRRKILRCTEKEVRSVQHYKRPRRHQECPSKCKHSPRTNSRH